VEREPGDGLVLRAEPVEQVDHVHANADVVGDLPGQAAVPLHVGRQQRGAAVVHPAGVAVAVQAGVPGVTAPGHGPVAARTEGDRLLAADVVRALQVVLPRIAGGDLHFVLAGPAVAGGQVEAAQAGGVDGVAQGQVEALGAHAGLVDRV